MSRFDDLQMEILHAAWKKAYEPGSNRFFSTQSLSEFFPSEKISSAALDALNGKLYLGSGSDNYWITEQGILYVEAQLEDPNSIFSRLDRPNENNPEQGHDREIPAADRLVTLDHNGDPYTDAIRALDAAVTAFKEDHALENEWGAEKSILLESIGAGQRLLQEAQVRTRSLIATIVEPLRIIADRYHEAALAGLVTAAVDRVLPLIEHAISSLLGLIGAS